MVNLKQISALSLIFCFVIAIGFHAPASAAETKPAIKVGSQSVDHSTVKKRINKQLKRMESRMGSRLQKNPSMKKKLRQRIKQRTVNQLVSKLTLLEHAEKANITVSEKEVDKKLSQMKQRMKGKKSFQQRLKAAGTTEEKLRASLKESLKIQKFIDQRIGKIKVSDSEARNFYEKNSKRFGNRSFSKLKPRIKQMLKQRKRSQKVSKLVSSLKKQTNITVRI